MIPKSDVENWVAHYAGTKGNSGNNAIVREIERLRKIETAARALKFSAYPAHGSGFVMQVCGGNISDLEAALAAHEE